MRAQGLLTPKLVAPVPQEMLLRYESTEKTAKLIAIACYMTYFTIGGAVVMLLWSIISKSFKK